MLAALVVAFVLGALFSLLVAASVWLFTAPLAAREDPDHVPGFRSASMPEVLVVSSSFLNEWPSGLQIRVAIM